MNKPDIGQMQRAAATSPYQHWVLFLGEEIILVIFDLAAIVIPPIAVEILFAGSLTHQRNRLRSSTSANCREHGARNDLYFERNLQGGCQ